jgi:hypothetical protein
MVVAWYWNHQRTSDCLIAACLALLTWRLPRSGIEFFAIEQSQTRTIALSWLSANLTLFGLVAATVAFVFSAVEAKEFKALRESKSNGQLWVIFAFTLQVILVSSIFCAFVSFLKVDILNSEPVQVMSSFLFALEAILLTKFTWAIVQIIYVKAR